MKRLVLMIITAMICGLILTNCDSDKTELTNGSDSDKTELTSGMGMEEIYFGTYTVTYFSSWAPNGSGTITIKLNNGKYTCRGIPHNQADISGNYSIDNDKITFEINVWETNYVDKNGNIMKSDFDTFIIPQGECDYSFEGNKLKISKVYDDFAHYEWNLEKRELSPPQWIQGEWKHDGFVYNVYFKFTSNDVIFALPYGSISSFNDLYEDGNYAIEETKKTDEIYEITVTRNQSKKISKFTKGDDGTHIQYYPFDTDAVGGLANDVIYILYKK